MSEIVMFLILGLAAGVLSGILGIGGGIVIIPALVYFFGFAQHRAAGTTLALMVPPIGLLAVLEYHKRGFVDVKAAALICAGFFVGGLIGGHFATELSGSVMQKIFGAFLLITAAKMLLFE
jgi:uncharacterized membrane protein YfcA